MSLVKLKDTKLQLSLWWQSLQSGLLRGVKSVLSPKRQGLSLENYALVDDHDEVENAFIKLRSHLWGCLEAAREENTGQILFYEHGRITAELKYFYIKPHNGAGWLFEEATSGWIVSRCEKNTDTFVRTSDPWDRILVYAYAHADTSSKKYGQQQEASMRLYSHRLGGQLVGQLYYQRWLAKTLLEVSP